MLYPYVTMHGARAIRIDFPRLFKNGESRTREEFLIRGFELEEVVSVEIDRAVGSALIHLHPRSAAPRLVLQRLAEKLEESRRLALVPDHRPYFLLQEDNDRSIYAKAPKTVSGIRRLLYVGLGATFFGLSIVGVVAPLVPTTPFVILSSYFALRSSPELNDLLIHSRLFGRILHDWHLYRAMRRSTKNRVLVFMVILFALTFGLAKPSGHALPTALLITLMSFWFILRMPTVDDETVA
ncbi:MAG: YbaN family protein, partial [Methylococcaceae bacterium]|nr:YbaN family protein [Methylococcaceae bacterium]